MSTAEVAYRVTKGSGLELSPARIEPEVLPRSEKYISLSPLLIMLA
jgi:hypothetical protein